MSVVAVDAAGSPGPLRALARLEARRSLRAPWLWLGLLLTGYLLQEVWRLDGQDGPYPMFATAFAPVGLAIFLVGLDAGSRDRRGDVPALAEEAVLGRRGAPASRLLSLWPVLLIGCGTVAVAGIVERTTGGLLLGDTVGGGRSMNHSLPELLQPVLLFVLAGVVGVAAGRVRNGRVPLAIAGVLVTFLLGVTAWAFQWSPARYLTTLQSQPVSVAIDAGGTATPALPADWVVDSPDQFHAEWRRVLVSPSMVAWHDAYLIGLIAIGVGIAVPSRWSRRLVVAGAVVALGGLIAQVLVAPATISLAGPP